MIDIFSTRAMLEMLDSMLPPRTFLRDNFFADTENPLTEHVDIDIRRGKRRMAAFVHPNHPGQMVQRDGYRTETYTPPFIKPKRVTTAEDVLKRRPGEGIYGAKSPDERAREILSRDLIELDDMITRREEWMAAQALFAGKVVCKGEGVDETVDFGLQNTHNVTLASGARWGDSGVDILETLRTWMMVPVKDSGIGPTDIIFGTKAWNVFRKDAAVQSALDCKNMNIGAIDPSIRNDGTIYQGYLTEVACRLWTYAEWYLDDGDLDSSGDPKTKPMVPESKILMVSRGLSGVRLYGAVVDAEDGTVAAARVPKSWTEHDPSLRLLQVRSRPLLVPKEIDSVFVATPVA
jgi:hypothetical protein